MGECLSTTSCDVLGGVGPRMLEHLLKLGLHSVQDILFHLPMRYQDKTQLMPINRLQPGQHALIEGEVLTAQIVFGKKRSLFGFIWGWQGDFNAPFFSLQCWK